MRERVARADQDLAFPQAAAIVAPAGSTGAAGPHRQQAVCGEGIVATADDGACFAVDVVRESGGIAGPRLHDHLHPRLDQRFHGCRHQGNAAFLRVTLLRNGYFHGIRSGLEGSGRGFVFESVVGGAGKGNRA